MPVLLISWTEFHKETKVINTTKARLVVNSNSAITAGTSLQGKKGREKKEIKYNNPKPNRAAVEIPWSDQE